MPSSHSNNKANTGDPVQTATNEPAIIPSVSHSMPTSIKFILPQAYKDGQDHYVVTTCPTTYEDATSKAIKLLGKYMLDPTPENTILRCSTKNRRGDWVWADIPPQDWTLTMSRFGVDEVGVFEGRINVKRANQEFVHGYVNLTVAKVEGSQLTWSKLSHENGKTFKSVALMNRPRSYKEAVEFVKHMIKTNPTIGTFLPPSAYNRDSFADNLTNFTFCYFLSNSGTNLWAEFPENAYEDDEVWRAIVPSPHSTLGVIAS